MVLWVGFLPHLLTILGTGLPCSHPDASKSHSTGQGLLRPSEQGVFAVCSPLCALFLTRDLGECDHSVRSVVICGQMTEMLVQAVLNLLPHPRGVLPPVTSAPAFHLTLYQEIEETVPPLPSTLSALRPTFFVMSGVEKAALETKWQQRRVGNPTCQRCLMIFLIGGCHVFRAEAHLEMYPSWTLGTEK